MRSSSRRPWLSNRQSSTFVAFCENRAKLVPRPSQVAPKGWGEPVDSRLLVLGNEKNCSKRWNDKADLGNSPLLQRPNTSGVPHIGSAVDGCVGVEHLAPEAREWDADPVVLLHLGREVHHHETTVVDVTSFTQPGKDAPVRIMHHQ